MAHTSNQSALLPHHPTPLPSHVDLCDVMSPETLKRVLKYIYLEHCYIENEESSLLVNFCQYIDAHLLTAACLDAAMNSVTISTCLNCYKVGHAFGLLALKRKSWRIAVEFGLISAVRRMSKDLTIINKRIDWGNRTALHISIENGYTEQALLLIQNGADVNATDCQGKSPLGLAAWVGSKSLMECLLEANAQIHSSDQWGQTALHKASSRGHADVVRLLLDQGARVNQKCKSDYTALHLAAMGGRNV